MTMIKSNDKYIYIHVYLHKKGLVPVGVITFNEKIGYSSFSYFSNYLEHNLPPINPATLNWREKNQKHFILDSKQNNQMLDRTFWELIPQNNDWGHQILLSKFPEYGSFNHAQKLYFLQKRQVGGLMSYTNEITEEENIQDIDWLDKIRDESVRFFLKELSQISFIKAINPLSNYGGVRPKCMFEDENGEFWIAKFNLPNDPYDMAIAETIAMEMARDMGLPCAETKVLTLPSGENVLLSKRFDRKGHERFHSLSLFALSQGHKIEKNSQFNGNPGNFIQLLINRYSDFENMDTVNVIAKMLLDIGVNNTDNHLRNMRIILNENYKWQLSPMYDIIFNPYSQNHIYNPACLPLEQLYLNNPSLIENMAKSFGVSPDIISKQVEKTKNILNNWESYCDKYSLNLEDKLKIGNAISLGLNRKELNKDLLLQQKNENKMKKFPKFKPNI